MHRSFYGYVNVFLFVNVDHSTMATNDFCQFFCILNTQGQKSLARYDSLNEIQQFIPALFGDC